MNKRGDEGEQGIASVEDDLALHVANALSGSWLDRDWVAETVEAFVARAAATGGVRLAPLRKKVALRMLRDPELMEFPPALAIKAQLQRLLALAPISQVSLWKRDDESGKVTISCVCTAGDGDLAEAEAVAAAQLGTGPGARHARNYVSAPIMRWQRPFGVMVARADDDCRDECNLLVSEAAAVLAPIIERENLLRRGTDRAAALVSASERALERLGLDLHDRPIQDLVVLADDLRLVRSQIATLLDGHEKAVIALGRFDDLEARLVALHAQLREMSQTLVSPMLLKRPLAGLLESEAEAFRSLADIDIGLSTAGDLESLSNSQRVALLRIAQEALSNVREHGGASRVEIRVVARRTYVEASITSDGPGFDVHDALIDAARRGRLGLVGMMERARLLGGSCEIRSEPGNGGVSVCVNLPIWDSSGDAAEQQPAIG